jgi:hypothetical protein
MNVNNLLLLSVVICIIYSCEQEDAVPPTETFKQTWYAGKAEINTYALQQARYGETRNGEAALIFVTEDFSTEKLVKLDEPEKTGDKVRVLKMNMTKNFVTGIYPYSMMLSVFTPVSGDGNRKTLKADCSSQEWCGQTFSQLQLKGNSYSWQLHSYFEKEGEQDKKLNAALMEDAVWNRIRINPSSLPQGKVSVLPGLLWQRLSHIELKEEDAVLTLSKADSFFIKDSGVQMYTIHYPSAQRTLQIYFQSAFPHEILGWQENYPDGFGNNKKMLITKAVKKKTAWLDYWKHNALADTTYRDTLQLMP